MLGMVYGLYGVYCICVWLSMVYMYMVYMYMVYCGEYHACMVHGVCCACYAESNDEKHSLKYHNSTPSCTSITHPHVPQ